MGSLAEQFAIKAKSVIGKKTTEAILDKLNLAAIEMVQRYAGTKNYYDVTGNLLNSFAVGVYHRSKLVSIADATNVGLEPPTRRSLAKGEKYNLSAYYTGEPVIHVMPDGKTVSRPFTGEYGGGGKDGISVARRSLRVRKPKATYALIAVVAMEYAKYVQNKRNHDVLTGLTDEIPGIFEGTIVTI